MTDDLGSTRSPNPDPRSPDPPRLHYGWIILATATLVVFGSLGLARFGYSVVLPSMQVGLSLDNTQTGALATANLVGYLSLSLIGGVLASRFGPRVVISTGLALAGLAMVLTGRAEGFADTASWRAVTGVGSGASNVPVMGLLAAWFGSRRRGLAAGIAASGSSLALILLGPGVPRILEAYGADGWRICWYLFGGAVLLLALISLVLLRDRPADRGLEPLGQEAGSVPPQESSTGGLDWARVYRSGIIWHMGLVYVAFGFSYIIYVTFFFKHLMSSGGYTPAGAGRMFMTMGWCSLVCGLLWGHVSDRIGRRATLAIVYLIHTTAFSLFALWTTPTGFLLSAVLYGLSAWGIPAIMAAACGDVLGPRLAPAALGFITLFFGIGQAAGPSVAGAMADAAGSFHSAFLLAAAVAFLGAIASLLLRKPSDAHPSSPS